MQISDTPKPIAPDLRARLDAFRTRLLSAGFLEPIQHQSSNWHWYFFRPDTELTAAAVNLQAMDGYLEVTYGYGSTAFTRMAGDENALLFYGLSNDDITLREKFLICDEADEQTAASLIATFLEKYHGTEKDALLLLAKNKRKAWISQFAVRLKPLGFRKKGNTWTKPLEGNYDLSFNLQKSSYADEYYFNVAICPRDSDAWMCCLNTRLGSGTFDWQSLTPEETEAFLDKTILPPLRRLIDTPFAALGWDPWLWERCHCDHSLCPVCWVAKKRPGSPITTNEPPNRAALNYLWDSKYSKNTGDFHQ